VNPGRLSFIHGDVTRPDLGLESGALLHLSRHVGEIWHLAASTSFDPEKRAEARAANVDGTQTLLRSAANFDHLAMLYHVSTAYVCGLMPGLVPEGHFPRPGEFRNVYEETKYDAECLVYLSALPHVIIRPSITVGHSRTGETFGERRMIYGYVLAMYHAALHVFGGHREFQDYWRCADGPASWTDVDVRLMAAARTPKNMVTVDDLAAVCLAIRRQPPSQCLGRTYHVVSADNLALGRMIDAAQRALRLRGFRYEPCLTRHALARANPAERAAFRHTRQVWPYLLPPEPIWESHNTRALGIDRVRMTDDLFQFLMTRFVEKELMKQW
jgi:nucleoside-diphosphate-sugar epimerase